MDLGLKGKVAMVAGASRGLGFAVARQLAAEGAHVSIASRDGAAAGRARDAIASTVDAPVLSVAADVRHADAITAWRDATVGRFGGIDLVFTNSGGPRPGGFADMSDEDWQGAFELLLLSAIRLVRAALPSMRARGSGSILLATSSSVKEPIAHLALSNVIRAGVAALAKTLANELAPDGIRVNHLVPGRIATDRLHELDAATAARNAVALDEQVRRAEAAIPLGRYGAPDDFGRAAAFLLSDAARYITGATLQVDGGLIRATL